MRNWILYVGIIRMVGACHQLGGDLPAPCDSLTLLQLRTECRAKVRAECQRSDAGVVDESCPALIACTKRIHEWHDCDAGTGEAGASQ